MNEIVSLDQVVSEIKFFENQAVVCFLEWRGERQRDKED